MNNFDSIQLYYLIYKIFFVLGALIYLIFASIVVRQTKSMTSKVQDMFNGLIIAFSWIHLLLAILLVVMAILL